MKNYLSATQQQSLIAGGKILSRILHQVAAEVRPGITGIQLNRLAEQLIQEAGAEPAFKGYGQPPYPNALCVSFNDCVVHGIATDRPAMEGDIVSLDLGIRYENLFTDMAITVGVGNIAKESQRLITAAQEALSAGIAEVKVGATTGDIGTAVQQLVEKQGFGVIRDFTGHGVGLAVHQEPAVPNYGRAGSGEKLVEGMVIAIEPMITLGDWHVKVESNGWDVLTVDHSLAAHFEHTVIITKEGAIIATA